MDEDDKPRFESFVGCALHFATIAAVTWLVIIGTALLVMGRWCNR